MVQRVSIPGVATCIIEDMGRSSSDLYAIMSSEILPNVPTVSYLLATSELDCLEHQ